MGIKSLREDLASLTSNLIDLMDKRKELVSNIQKQKKINQQITFDYKQEEKVFTTLKDKLISLSQKELLAVSLLIESHAGHDYPEWSSQEHLNSHSSLVYESINPVMLLILDQASFNMLDLKELYKAQFNER